MKKVITSIILFFIAIKLISQPLTSRIDTYKFPKEIEGVRTVSIKMPFGKSNPLLIAGDTAELRNAGNILIDVVCTDFPSNMSLSLLNKGRIKEFYKLFPYINPSQVIKIEILRQMDGAEKKKAQEMFHGLIIKFRPPQTKETMLHDIAKMDEILEIKDKEINYKKTNDTITERKKEISKDKVQLKKDTLSIIKNTLSITPWTIKIKKSKAREWRDITAGASRERYKKLGHDSSCCLLITPKEALKRGLITRKEYNGPGRTGPGIIEIGWKAQDTITILVCSGHHISDSLKKESDFYSLELDSTSITKYSLNPDKHPLPDSTILKIFGRNKWANMDIVGDVTGSMYPYTVQLLLWLKLQSLDSLTANYSFFNDGDDLPDKKKKLGRTGGIYSKKCSSFSEVLDLVKSTMMKGGGGDCPENNIEALIEAEKKFPDIAFHVLIADNWASIKDISLVNQLTKPVRVVLCGVLGNALNTEYLDLARLTRGSVHLLEDDLLNLATMHEGETLRLGKKEFKIVDGHFKEIGESIQKRYAL